MYITASTAILANAYQVGFLLDKNEHQWNRSINTETKPQIYRNHDRFEGGEHLNANEHTKSITDFGRVSSQFVTLQIKNTKNLKPCALASARLTGGTWCIVYSILTGITQSDVFKFFSHVRCKRSGTEG